MTVGEDDDDELDEIVDIVEGLGVEEDFLELGLHLELEADLGEDEEQEEVGFLDAVFVELVVVEGVGEEEAGEREAVFHELGPAVAVDDADSVLDEFSLVEVARIGLEDDVDEDEDREEGDDDADIEVFREGEVVGDGEEAEDDDEEFDDIEDEFLSRVQDVVEEAREEFADLDDADVEETALDTLQAEYLLFLDSEILLRESFVIEKFLGARREFAEAELRTVHESLVDDAEFGLESAGECAFVVFLGGSSDHGHALFLEGCFGAFRLVLESAESKFGPLAVSEAAEDGVVFGVSLLFGGARESFVVIVLEWNEHFFFDQILVSLLIW